MMSNQISFTLMLMTMAFWWHTDGYPQMAWYSNIPGTPELKENNGLNVRENANAKIYIIQMGEMLVFKSSCAWAFLIITWVPWPWDRRVDSFTRRSSNSISHNVFGFGMSYFMCCVNFSNFWNFIKIGDQISRVKMRNGVHLFYTERRKQIRDA